MRWRPSRALYSGIFVIVFALIWLIFHSKYPEFSHTCVYPTTFQNNLHALAFRVHQLLDMISLTHCLCYGALWGQIRRSQSLPWEADVEFCLRNEELSSYDENFIERLFRKRNLTLNYDSAEGVYTVTDEAFQQGASIKLVLFESNPEADMLKRVGWKRRVLPPNCEDMTSLECFPERLMLKPLPLKDFGGKLLPVPKEDIEILKYHYPTNWWTEHIPFNC